MVCPCCVGSSARCCCKPDGTVTEIVLGDPCDGTVTTKPSETCSWDGVTMTFTVCGVSATAAVGLWESGQEPEFTAGSGPGNGVASGACLRRDDAYGGAFTFNRFTFDTGGGKYCHCNFREIYLDQVVLTFIDDANPGNVKQASCRYTVRINECTDEMVIAEYYPEVYGPACCPDACEVLVTVNWAP